MFQKEAIQRTRVLIADLKRRIDTGNKTSSFRQQLDMTCDFVLIHTNNLMRESEKLVDDFENLEAILADRVL